MAQAQEELTVLARRIAAAHADSNEGWSARVVAAHEQLVAQSRPALVVLMGAVAFLLLIVCANMANLLLARSSSRRREIAVRGALGAGRWEVARPILAESLLLATGGGLLGLLAAFGGLRLLARCPPANCRAWIRFGSTAACCSLPWSSPSPSPWRSACCPPCARRANLRNQMHESSGSTGSPYARRVLSGLVVVEVALALVLLVGAGLMTRSFQKLLQVSPGFDSTNLVAARVLLPTTKYNQRPAVARFYEDVVERLRRAPGVTGASAVSAMPLHNVGAAGALPFSVAGQPRPRPRIPWPTSVACCGAICRSRRRTAVLPRCSTSLPGVMSWMCAAGILALRFAWG